MKKEFIIAVVVLLAGIAIAGAVVHAAPAPLPKIIPKPPVKSLSSLSGNACEPIGNFTAIFYDDVRKTSRFTWPTSAQYLYNLSEHWGTTAPAPGVKNDNDWSAQFSSNFTFTIDTPPIPARFLVYVYTKFQGYAKVIINGISVFEGQNTAMPLKFDPQFVPTLESDGTHSMTVEYINDEMSDATLELTSILCDADNPTVCWPEELFFGDEYVGQQKDLGELFYDKSITPEYKIAVVGERTEFDIDVVSYGSPSRIQWQLKHLGGPAKSVDWENCDGIKCNGASTETLLYGPVEKIEDTFTAFRAQISNDVCQFMENIHPGLLDVLESTPTPTPTGSSTPTPTPCFGTCPALTCSADKPTAKPDETVTLTGSGGDPKTYKWSSDGIPPSCNDPVTCPAHPQYKTHWISEGSKEVKLYAGGITDPAICKVEVTVTTPTPTPTSGPLKCVLVDGGRQPTKDDPIEALVDERIYLKAVGGKAGDYAWSSENYPDPSGVQFGETYSPKYDTPSTRYRDDTLEIKLKSNGEEALCYAKILAPTTTPTPSTTPDNLPQAIDSMFVYNGSPIDPDDCSKTTSKFPTAEFPSGECDPHEETGFAIPSITRGTFGLKYSSIYGDLLTVVPENPAWAVVDSNEDPLRAGFKQYNSLFSGGVQNERRISEVAQVNAYREVMFLLREFANLIWPFGAMSDDPYRPNQFADFSPLQIKILLKSLCKTEDELVSLHLPCALDNEVIDHEFYHFMQNALLSIYEEDSGYEWDALA